MEKTKPKDHKVKKKKKKKTALYLARDTPDSLVFGEGHLCNVYSRTWNCFPLHNPHIAHFYVTLKQNVIPGTWQAFSIIPGWPSDLLSVFRILNYSTLDFYFLLCIVMFVLVLLLGWFRTCVL